jgi:hypothetical protein
LTASIKINLGVLSAKSILTIVFSGAVCVKIAIKNGRSLPTTICAALKIGVTMNKLDTFNKDKRKCKKCKDYLDKHDDYIRGSLPLLCKNCDKKWHQFVNIRHKVKDGSEDCLICWVDFLNEQQT